MQGSSPPLDSLGCYVTLIHLFSVNIVSWSDLNSNAIFGESVSSRAKIFLFVAFIVCFGGIIVAVWIGVQVYFTERKDGESTYGGAAIIVQNVLIFCR